MANDEENFARRMAELRTMLNLSQSELARKMVENGFDTYSQMTVSRTEKGERPVRLNEARTLAEILGSSVDSMTRGTQLEEFLESAERVTQRLIAAIMSVPLALFDYFVAVEEETVDVRMDFQLTAGLRDLPEARYAYERMSSLRFSTQAVAQWAGEVAESERELTEDGFTQGDYERLKELTEHYRSLADGDPDGEHQTEA